MSYFDDIPEPPLDPPEPPPYQFPEPPPYEPPYEPPEDPRSLTILNKVLTPDPLEPEPLDPQHEQNIIDALREQEFVSHALADTQFEAQLAADQAAAEALLDEQIADEQLEDALAEGAALEEEIADEQIAEDQLEDALAEDGALDEQIADEQLEDALAEDAALDEQIADEQLEDALAEDAALDEQIADDELEDALAEDAALDEQIGDDQRADAAVEDALIDDRIFEQELADDAAEEVGIEQMREDERFADQAAERKLRETELRTRIRTRQLISKRLAEDAVADGETEEQLAADRLADEALADEQLEDAHVEAELAEEASAEAELEDNLVEEELAKDAAAEAQLADEALADRVAANAAVEGRLLDQVLRRRIRSQQVAADRLADEAGGDALYEAQLRDDHPLAPQSDADPVDGEVEAPVETAASGEEHAAGRRSPDEMPSVLLVDVTPAQLEAVLLELEGSTATGRDIARRVRSGELQLTLDTGRITERATGLAMPNEVHVSWEGSVQDVAGTLIHEAVHQGDPGLAGGTPRSEVEASARVGEFEYRQEAGLPPRDEVENIYRAVLEQGIEEGTPPAEAQVRARQAMIDMMRTSPNLYGVEPGGGVKDPQAGSGPALSANLNEYGLPLTPTEMTSGGADPRTAGTGGISSIKQHINALNETEVVIEGRLLDSITDRDNAPNFNREKVWKVLRKEHDLPDWQAAHLWGPGFGDEAAAGIMLAPPDVNLVWQNQQVERFLRDLHQTATAEGAQIHVRAVAVSHERTLVGGTALQHVEYTFAVGKPGGQREGFGKISFSVDRPPSGKVSDPSVVTFSIPEWP